MLGYVPPTLPTKPPPRDGFTTPPPSYTDEPPVRLADLPAKLEHNDSMRIRAAALRAQRLYPGPVGDLVARELNHWAELGYLLDQSGHAMRLVKAIMAQDV